MIVTWVSDNFTPDLAGYQVEYTFPAWDAVWTGNLLTGVRRVIPHSQKSVPPGYSGTPYLEHVRLGGLWPC